MTNRHGLKLKKKNIVLLLQQCYEQRTFLENKLKPLNDKIYRLEKCRNNVSNQLKEGSKTIRVKK